LELQEILGVADNPQVMAALLFKLVQERENTNRLLAQINEKYDSLLKNQRIPVSPLNSPIDLDSKQTAFSVLPEHDQLILTLVAQKGQVDSAQVKVALGYKGLNAACQRLNRLYQLGHLKKVQSGKRVVYLAVDLR
jgi:hypothetical protein